MKYFFKKITSKTNFKHLKMRKLGIVIMFILTMIGSKSIAQTFGIKAGMNFSNMLNKDNDFKYSEEYKTRIGFNIGATMELPLSGPILFETGLIIDTKGYKRTIDGNNIQTKIRFNTTYLDIPLHIKYAFEFSGLKPYVAAGPYIGFGISGKIISKTVVSGISSETSDAVNWGNDNGSDLKQLDGGFDFGAGLEFGNIYLGANYSLGLANICPNPDNGQKYNNRLFSISVGYKFGGN